MGGNILLEIQWWKFFPAPRSKPASLCPRLLFILQPYLPYNFHGSTRLGPQISFIDLLRCGVTVGGASFKRSQVGATILTWVQIPAVAKGGRKKSMHHHLLNVEISCLGATIETNFGDEQNTLFLLCNPCNRGMVRFSPTHTHIILL